MTYRKRGGDEDLLHTVVIGSIGGWIAALFVDAFIGWWDRRDAARIRRERLNRARPQPIHPSRMWWDEGALPAGATPPPPDARPRRSLMWWEERPERPDRSGR